MSYGVDLPNVFRQTAAYVDRILNGANPADLPVFLPTKFELVINLTTAKTLGIEVPLGLMVRADELLDSDECLLLAQSRHPDRVGECPLSGVKRTSPSVTPRLLLTLLRHGQFRIFAAQIDR